MPDPTDPTPPPTVRGDRADQPQVAVGTRGSSRLIEGPSTLWWLVTLVLAVALTAVLVRRDANPWLDEALAQAGPAGGVGARGIYAFTGQLSSRSFGLFMMDVDSATVWCYEIDHGPHGGPLLKLVAARSWMYDRYLEEFNVADPTPTKVRKLVELQRAAQRAADPAEVGAQTGDTSAGRTEMGGDASPAGRTGLNGADRDNTSRSPGLVVPGEDPP